MMLARSLLLFFSSFIILQSSSAVEETTMGNCSNKTSTLNSMAAAGTVCEAVGPNGMSNIVALGAGCYWGTEYIKKNFQTKFPNSIKSATVGFMSPEDSPRIANPSYSQVCTGRSGHVEVLYVELNDPEAHFEDLVKFFFTFHDPTTLNRQGNDAGFQYASYIFVADVAQHGIAKKVLAELQFLLDREKVKSFSGKKITTKIGPLKSFTAAQADHQAYLEKNPGGYCNHRIRIKKWPKVDAVEQAPALLREDSSKQEHET